MSKPTNAAIVDLNGRKWNPFESMTASGHVTFTETEGEIHVPYGTDPVSTTIQAHELSHVRYTSKVWVDAGESLKRLTALASTNHRIVGYAEDMRITALAGRLKLKTLPDFSTPEDKSIIDRWITSFVSQGIPKDRVERAVRFILSEHTSVLKDIGLKLSTLQQQANAEAYIVHCAQYLHKLLTTGEDEKPKKGDEGKSDKKKSDDTSKSDKSSKSEAEKSDEAEDSGDKSEDGDEADDQQGGEAGEGDGEADGQDEAGDSEAEDGNGEGEAESSSKGKPSAGGGAKQKLIDLTDLDLTDIRQEMLKSVPPPPDTEALIQRFQHTLDTAPWIPVKTIKRMPLVRRAAQSRNKGRKLSESGVALGSAYDAVSPNERRPFVAKRRGGIGGLVVVIDCSGSMHIDPKQLERLLLAHPQGVVVTYSSDTDGAGPYDNNHAEVRVIASHGRLAATDDFRDIEAEANGCDGPVLEWLAKQSGERVWVCDGIITGRGDIGVSYDYAAMTAWLKAHHITKFFSLEDYLKSLT